MASTTVKKSLYEILGVSIDATVAEIKAAYDAKIAQRGNASSDHDRSARVAFNEAFSVLSNEQRRAAYDARLRSTSSTAAASTTASAAEEPGSSRRWLLVATVSVLLIGGWYAMRHRTPAPQAASVTRLGPMTSISAAPSITAASPAPAAQGELSPEQLYATVSTSIVRVSVAKRDGTGTMLGSGVILGADSVITNCHVVMAGDQVEVRERNAVFSATVTVADEALDLCRLRVSGLTGRAAPTDAAPAPRVGQRVYAIGSPQGLDLTLSEGLVSALREGPSGTYIQTTAPVSPGSSGGGLFDHQGNLIGIVTFQMRAGQNLNFAIPVEWIDKMTTRRRDPDREVVAQAPPTFAPTERYRDAIWLGTWHCFGPLTGRGMDIVFEANGTFTGKLEGKPSRGYYTMTKTELMLTDSQQGMTFAIEELAARRMVINRGQGRRLVCDR